MAGEDDDLKVSNRIGVGVLVTREEIERASKSIVQVVKQRTTLSDLVARDRAWAVERRIASELMQPYELPPPTPEFLRSAVLYQRQVEDINRLVHSFGLSSGLLDRARKLSYVLALMDDGEPGPIRIRRSFQARRGQRAAGNRGLRTKGVR